MVASVPELTSRTCSSGGRCPAGVARVDPRDDLARQLDLAGRRRAEGQTVRGGGGDGRDDVGVGVAEDHRPPRADEVDVLLPSTSVRYGAAAAGHEPRGAADGPEGAHRRVDPAGDDLLRPLEQGGGGGSVCHSASVPIAPRAAGVAREFECSAHLSTENSQICGVGGSVAQHAPAGRAVEGQVDLAHDGEAEPFVQRDVAPRCSTPGRPARRRAPAGARATPTHRPAPAATPRARRGTRRARAAKPRWKARSSASACGTRCRSTAPNGSAETSWCHSDCR